MVADFDDVVGGVGCFVDADIAGGGVVIPCAAAFIFSEDAAFVSNIESEAAAEAEIGAYIVVRAAIVVVMVVVMVVVSVVGGIPAIKDDTALNAYKEFDGRGKFQIIITEGEKGNGGHVRVDDTRRYSLVSV